MRRIFLSPLGFIAMSCVLLSGCASIVSRSNYPVYIHTNPAGVDVSITDKKGKEVFKGQSPVNVTLKTGAGYFAKAEYAVKLSSPGFADKIVPINYKINGWYFGNLLLGGVIGMLIVDPMTGAMWKPQDPVIDETLKKSTHTALHTTQPELKIVNIKDVPASEKSKLVKIN